MRFNLLVACSVKCGRGWRLPETSWPDHRLLLVRGGSGVLKHAGQQRPLKRGDVVFGFPHEVYGVSQNERHRLVVSVVRFTVSHSNGAFGVLPTEFRSDLCVSSPEFPLLEQLAMRLIRSIPRLPCGENGLTDSLLRSLLWLCREGCPSAEPSVPRDLGLQELRPFVEHPFDDGVPPPATGTLAQLCGMSESTFRRRMAECFGMTPAQFLLQRRIERAKSLLVESPYTVQAIAAELGYGETSHFSRQFKKVVGISPAAFRTSRS